MNVLVPKVSLILDDEEGTMDGDEVGESDGVIIEVLDEEIEVVGDCDDDLETEFVSEEETEVVGDCDDDSETEFVSDDVVDSAGEDETD